MPPTLNPSIYSKIKPLELSPFLLHKHVLGLFSQSLIFFLSIHFINFMFLVLYSHTLIAFYLPHSSIWFLSSDFHDYLTHYCFNMHKMPLRYISLLAISSLAPTIWNNNPFRDSLTTCNFKKKLKFHFLKPWIALVQDSHSSLLVYLSLVQSASVLGMHACKLI